MNEFTAPDGTRFVAVSVHGIRRQAPGDEPVLILHWVQGGRVLPAWIDPGDIWKLLDVADRPNRPTACDALGELISLQGGEIARVEVAGYHEGVFIADLVIGGVLGEQLGDESDELRVDLRLSDAVALALEAGAPIYASIDVIEAASIADGPVVESDEDREAAARDSVDEFRRFLDSIDAADFGDSGGDGAGRDSDDGADGGK